MNVCKCKDLIGSEVKKLIVWKELNCVRKGDKRYREWALGYTNLSSLWSLFFIPTNKREITT